MQSLIDIDSERGLLSLLINGGSIVYHEIEQFAISDTTFSLDSHKILWKCLYRLLHNNDCIIPDIPLIYSAATELGLKHYYRLDEEASYLKAIIDLPVKTKNVLIFARKIKKLEIARKLYSKLEQTKDSILEIKGNESIHEIFSILENNIIDCANLLNMEGLEVTKLVSGIDEFVSTLENNPIDQVGISTGFPVWDMSIGGGLRPGTVNIIAARPKCGKSTLAMNIASHIAKLNIPVLLLDTEMSKEDLWVRLIASLSEISIKDIETGKYATKHNLKNKVAKTLQSIKKWPIHYCSISGQSIETQISLIKRWLITTVGLNMDGSSKKCCIIYDYLKIMDKSDIKNIQEHQAIGFFVSNLINFAKKYKVPILAFVQMNRDGINREDTATISLSDRILWFCSSLSIFKVKSTEEMDRDGWEYGNRKLKPLDCRYGPSLHDMDYINCNFNKNIAKIIEGKTKFELEKERKEYERLNKTIGLNKS